MSEQTRAFGFRQIPDTRDLRFPMQVGASAAPLPAVKRWRIGTVLDQGAEGACVGFACKHLLTAEPFIQTHGPTAREIYFESRLNDEFDDRLVPEGTSVRAGLQTLRRHGLIVAFHWAPDLQTVLRYLATEGPVVVGSNWHSYSTDFDGRVTFSGQPVGGHAWLCTGYDEREKVLFGVNSWGPSFGKSGEFFVTFADMENQMHRHGAVVAGVKER
jgi:hypothetical protein